MDIEGTTANTLKHGVVTNRLTNPLDPNYQMPGYLEPPENDLKGKAGEEGFSMARKVQNSQSNIQIVQATQSQTAKPPR